MAFQFPPLSTTVYFRRSDVKGLELSAATFHQTAPNKSLPFVFRVGMDVEQPDELMFLHMSQVPADLVRQHRALSVFEWKAKVGLWSYLPHCPVLIHQPSAAQLIVTLPCCTGQFAVSASNLALAINVDVLNPALNTVFRSSERSQGGEPGAGWERRAISKEGQKVHQDFSAAYFGNEFSLPESVTVTGVLNQPATATNDGRCRSLGSSMLVLSPSYSYTTFFANFLLSFFNPPVGTGNGLQHEWNQVVGPSAGSPFYRLTLEVGLDPQMRMGRPAPFQLAHELLNLNIEELEWLPKQSAVVEVRGLLIKRFMVLSPLWDDKAQQHNPSTVAAALLTSELETRELVVSDETKERLDLSHAFVTMQPSSMLGESRRSSNASHRSVPKVDGKKRRCC